MKRVVSLVPSWTETLIEAGVQVVGRTRFCIHPQGLVSAIESVGGTKSFNEKKLRDLAPDLIVLDREENTKEMFEIARTISNVVVTHVEDVQDVPRELRALAGAIESPENATLKLRDWAQAFEDVLKKPAPVKHNHFAGILKTLRGQPSLKTEFVYVIWKDPWMVVGQRTFIASMLREVGLTQLRVVEPGAKYPKLEELPQDAMVLLSSEPYPFETKTPDLPNACVVIVDGESFSWFGIRALRFLESAKG